MGNTLITVEADACEDGCAIEVSWPELIYLIAPLLVVLSSLIYFIYRQIQRRNRTTLNDKCLLRCEQTFICSSNNSPIHFPFIALIVPKNSTKIHRDTLLFSISESSRACITSVDIYAVPCVQKNISIEQVVSSTEERNLICYCDGSYSPYMHIGYSGFRASDGAYRIRFFSPHDPKSGSTDTEVLAASLAIQYALKKRYKKLLLHTDNSKVEQLLLRGPKSNDLIKYSDICQILERYQDQQGSDAIQVIRVRGHTSKYEQENCKAKYEFAQIDQAVRRRMRRYIRNWWIRFERTRCVYTSISQSPSAWAALKYYT